MVTAAGLERCHITGLKMEERGHKPRSGDNLSKVKRQESRFFPPALRKAPSLADTLLLAQ